MQTVLRWLSRFSFTLIILGFLLFYQVYLSTSGRAEKLAQWQMVLLILGGVCCVSLVLRGIRERHRRQP